MVGVHVAMMKSVRKIIPPGFKPSLFPMQKRFYCGERKMSEWISVDERLPEARTRVIAVAEEGYWVMWIAERNDGGHWVVSQSGAIIYPTHWQPLPEPPEDQS